MSDTNVNTVNPETLFDLFPEVGTTSGVTGKPTFGQSNLDTDVNLFPKPAATPVVDPAKPAEGVKPDGDGDAAAKPAGDAKPLTEADILNADGKNPPAQVLTGLTEYYKDRVEKGKFIAVTQEDDKGNVIPFIPKTAEEYDEVLDLQINHRMAQAKKQIEQTWYESKSPAWKAISQYAELVDNPSDLIPFLQGVKTIQSVASLNEDEADGAERIVRARMQMTGEPDEIINSQIEALKTTDKLVATAKQIKPLILQQEQAQLLQLKRNEEEANRKYWTEMNDIRDNALKSIEKPIFGKTALKNEEKALIYDLIAEPAEETQGFQIYNKIDELFAKRDFETLKEIALLLAKKDSFYNYLGINIANQTAASLEKKLRLAGESRTASGHDFDEGPGGTPTINRNQFNKKPSFGRT